MPLHIIKLCVGADSIEDLQQWIDETQAERRRLGRPAEQVHTTRMTPRRRDEVLDGGSLYWVIRGVLQVRQPIRDLRPVKGDDGIERCEIVLEPVLVPRRLVTAGRARRGSGPIVGDRIVTVPLRNRRRASS